jgi:hypothetical protein
MSQIEQFSPKTEIMESFRSKFFLKIKSLSLYGTKQENIKAYINFDFDASADPSKLDFHQKNWIKFMEFTEQPNLTGK